MMTRLGLVLKGAFPIGHISHRKDGDYKKISRNKWERVGIFEQWEAKEETPKKEERQEAVSLEDAPRTDAELFEMYQRYHGKLTGVVARGKTHPKVALLNRVDKQFRHGFRGYLPSVENLRERRSRERALVQAQIHYYKYLGFKAIDDPRSKEEYTQFQIASVRAYPGKFWNTKQIKWRVPLSKIKAWVSGKGPSPKASGLGHPREIVKAATQRVRIEYRESFFVDDLKRRQATQKKIDAAGDPATYFRQAYERDFGHEMNGSNLYGAVTRWNTPTAVSPKEYATAAREVALIAPEDQIVITEADVTKILAKIAVRGAKAGGHWGSAHSKNSIAKGVAGLRRDEWRPLDEEMDVRPTGTWSVPAFFNFDPKRMKVLRDQRKKLTPKKFEKWVLPWMRDNIATKDHGLVRDFEESDLVAIVPMMMRWYAGTIREGLKKDAFIEAMKLRTYAQRKMKGTAREGYPSVFRGMALPSSLLKGLKDGDVITMTGATAWSFYDEIAERYSGSSWTSYHSGEGDLGVILKMKRSDDFDGSISMWHPNKGRGLTSEGGRKGAFEILSDLTKIKVVKVEKPPARRRRYDQNDLADLFYALELTTYGLLENLSFDQRRTVEDNIETMLNTASAMTPLDFAEWAPDFVSDQAESGAWPKALSSPDVGDPGGFGWIASDTVAWVEATYQPASPYILEVEAA